MNERNRDAKTALKDLAKLRKSAPPPSPKVCHPHALPTAQDGSRHGRHGRRDGWQSACAESRMPTLTHGVPHALLRRVAIALAGTWLVRTRQARPFEGMFSRISPEKKRIGNEQRRNEQLPPVRPCPYSGLKNEGATCYLNSVLQVSPCCPFLLSATPVVALGGAPPRASSPISLFSLLSVLATRTRVQGPQRV